MRALCKSPHPDVMFCLLLRSKPPSHRHTRMPVLTPRIPLWLPDPLSPPESEPVSAQVPLLCRKSLLLLPPASPPKPKPSSVPAHASFHSSFPRYHALQHHYSPVSVSNVPKGNHHNRKRNSQDSTALYRKQVHSQRFCPECEKIPGVFSGERFNNRSICIRLDKAPETAADWSLRKSRGREW